MSVEAFCSSPEGMTQSHENIGQILKQRMRSSRRQQNITCGQTVAASAERITKHFIERIFDIAVGNCSSSTNRPGKLMVRQKKLLQCKYYNVILSM